MSGNILGFSQMNDSAGTQCVEARDTARQLTIPIAENDLAPNANSPSANLRQRQIRFEPHKEENDSISK